MECSGVVVTDQANAHLNFPSLILLQRVPYETGDWLFMMTPTNAQGVHGASQECFTIGTAWIINLVKRYSQNMLVNIFQKTNGPAERWSDGKNYEGVYPKTTLLSQML
jgi:hypothetical protein